MCVFVKMLIFHIIFSRMCVVVIFPQAANRAAGIGDEQGRLPSRVKAVEVMAKCTVCSQEIRTTKKNIEVKSHWESKHPTCTFSVCFPGVVDPTTAPVEVEIAGSAAPTASVAAPKKKKTEDLSFLDDALTSKAFVGKKK